jgi:hypothetical protein
MWKEELAGGSADRFALGKLGPAPVGKILDAAVMFARIGCGLAGLIAGDERVRKPVRGGSRAGNDYQEKKVPAPHRVIPTEGISAYYIIDDDRHRA